MTKTPNNKIIFFDGVCHLCNGFVDFVISADKHRKFKFAPLQGPTAEKYLSEQDRKSLESVILYVDDKAHYQSTAILKILKELGAPYSLLFAFIIIPSFIRNFFYKIIAKNRYSWFGEKDSCRIPQAHEREYLLP